MLSTTTILKKVNELEAIDSHEGRLQYLLEIYLELFPVDEAFLFRYSHFGYLAEGVLSLADNKFKNISFIRDDVRSIPGILSSLQQRKAKYYEGADYFKTMGTKYVYSHSSGLVVPITVHTLVIGYLITNQFKTETPINEQHLSFLTFFGKNVGQVLCHPHDIDIESTPLSRREMQVMQKIANGDSTKEIAGELRLREVTINQYIKSALHKLNAKNRVDD